MLWIGNGPELWRVRVDLFAEDADASRVSAAVEGLGRLVTGDDGNLDRQGVDGDQGVGITKRPVVGLLFWVRAADVGGAATIAVDAARRAGSGCGVGPTLYDVLTPLCLTDALPSSRFVLGADCPSRARDGATLSARSRR